MESVQGQNVASPLKLLTWPNLAVDAMSSKPDFIQINALDQCCMLPANWQQLQQANVKPSLELAAALDTSITFEYCSWLMSNHQLGMDFIQINK